MAALLLAAFVCRCERIIFAFLDRFEPTAVRAKRHLCTAFRALEKNHISCSTTSSTTTPAPLSSCGARIGLSFIAHTACLSFIAVVSLLAYVFCLAFKNRRTPGWRLIRSHLDIYLLGLLCSDLIQSIGGMMKIRWIAMARIEEGRYCTAQGILEQFGDVGVALCTLAIATHTFAELVLRWKEPKSLAIPIVVLSLYVTFLTLVIGVGYAVHHNEGQYYGDTKYWCWITPRFLKAGIGLEYLWFWVAALASLILYLPVFLALKGIIIVEPSDTWLRYRVRRTTRKERHVLPKNGGAVNPRRMLFYPAVYIVTVLPIAIARITSLAHPKQNVPFAAIAFSAILFSASGVFNVIVYTSTRPALLRPSAIISDAPPDPNRDSRVPQLFFSDADQTDTEVQNVSDIPSMHLAGSPIDIDHVHPPSEPRGEQDRDTRNTENTETDSRRS